MAYAGLIESFWRGVGIQLAKRWTIVLVVILAVTAALSIGLTRSEFATGQDSYLNPDSRIALDNVVFQDQFGGETIVLLFTATGEGTDVTDLVEGANLDELERLNGELAEIPDVRSVITSLTSLTFSDALGP